MKREIDLAQDTIERVTGKTPLLFRPSKEKWNLFVLKYLIKRKITMVLWSIAPKDFNATSAEDLVRKACTFSSPSGDIALLHDNNKYTVYALTRIILEAKPMKIIQIS